MTGDRSADPLPRILLIAVLVLTLVSAFRPYERLTWWLEAGPVLLGCVLLIVSRRRFPLTRLLYVLLFVHACILLLGAHYTYARVPPGDWVAEWLDLSRNHYDRLGHLAQGFVPAILAREVLLRCLPLRPGVWLFYLVFSVCLAFSAFYELTEWWAALLGGEAADSFLGTQGDEWDTQWDMFLAAMGAIAAQLLLGRVHDRALRNLVHRR